MRIRSIWFIAFSGNYVAWYTSHGSTGALHRCEADETRRDRTIYCLPSSVNPRLDTDHLFHAGRAWSIRARITFLSADSSLLVRLLRASCFPLFSFFFFLFFFFFFGDFRWEFSEVCTCLEKRRTHVRWCWTFRGMLVGDEAWCTVALTLCERWTGRVFRSRVYSRSKTRLHILGLGRMFRQFLKIYRNYISILLARYFTGHRIPLASFIQISFSKLSLANILHL